MDARSTERSVALQGSGLSAGWMLGTRGVWEEGGILAGKRYTVLPAT